MWASEEEEFLPSSLSLLGSLKERTDRERETERATQTTRGVFSKLMNKKKKKKRKCYDRER